jgi:CheY-like chemotaxis protein
MNPEAVTILLVEDDDGHATLIEKNLRRAGLSNNFLRFRDGQEVLEHFAQSNACTSGSPEEPCCLVLLDINMPRVNGIEVLRHLKANAATEKIPVIMLTTTDDPREVDRCYELGCNVYVTKPVEYEPFLEAIKRLGLFLQVVKLPPKTGATSL